MYLIKEKYCNILSICIENYTKYGLQVSSVSYISYVLFTIYTGPFISSYYEELEKIQLIQAIYQCKITCNV